MFLFVSCSKVGKSTSDVVIIDDKPKSATKDEIVIDDKLLGDATETLALSQTGSQETTKLAFDQSRVNTMYDQFGNKTESRCFNNHLRLQCIMLRTAADGQKQTFVYGHNGEVKALPEDMLDKAMTAPADELANLAGIYQTYRQSPPVARSTESRNNIALRPMPSYNFPVQNRQVDQVAADEAKSTAVPAEEKPIEKKDDSSMPKPDKEQ
jgi:hypothetical protein